MSYGSDYRDRRRRNRRQDQRLIIYAIRSIVTTAALVGIAFAFDVPEKIREKLRGPVPDRIEANIEARELPSVEESPQALADPIRQRPLVRPDIAINPESTGPTESELATSPEKPLHPPPPSTEVEHVNPSVDEDENIGQHVKLELDKKRMKIPLAELTAEGNPVGRVRVIALRKLKEKYELAPADGLVGADDDLQILFPEYPRARILVRTDKIGQHFFLVVEPQMALWADKPMPYTLTKIKGEAFQTRRAADEFFASLAAAKEEKAALEVWIKAPVAKALAERGRAQRRVAQLSNLIKQMEGRVEEVQQGVQQINALERLARVLHDRAVLQFEVVDSR